MANKDGGAHEDLNELDVDYLDLTTDDVGIHWEEGGEDRTMDPTWPNPADIRRFNTAASSVRQIAYEVTSTLQSYLDNQTS